ncbi:hypothetical protein BDZ94DRAFT_1249164, partial [Collybia nuda]
MAIFSCHSQVTRNTAHTYRRARAHDPRSCEPRSIASGLRKHLPESSQQRAFQPPTSLKSETRYKYFGPFLPFALLIMALSHWKPKINP